MPRNATAFADLSALPDEPSYYRVRATNDVGVSEWSNRARDHVAEAFPSLRIERLGSAEIVLTFDAMAGQSYTLQSRSGFSTGTWSNQTQFVALPTNAVVRFTNIISGSEAYYRLSVP